MDAKPIPERASAELARVVGVPGAVLMGLGSILGTGIFVSLGIAAGVTGPSVILAVAVAAVVATFNGLSSAQLAASHPVSGGTYEYGHRYLNPTLGFTAGWMFLCAKSASAATAALGFAGYVLVAAGVSAPTYRVPLALAAVVALTLIVAGGIGRSNRANSVIVALTLLALFGFVGFGFPSALSGASSRLDAFFAGSGGGNSATNFLHATALMFVAYTGYGRVATLGEEIRDPRRNIPRAIIVTLVATATIYALVAFVAVASASAGGLADATRQAAAPLAVVARGFGVPAVAWLVAAGAVTAMLGVLLNLLLGLSRVVLAMARRGDVPSLLARVDERRSSPTAAVLSVGAITAGLAAIGNVKTTWSFSAFTVLVYYALTNLAALRLPPEARRYPRWIPAAGLTCCLGLAFWVEPAIWVSGLGLIAIGLVWHRVARRRARIGSDKFLLPLLLVTLCTVPSRAAERVPVPVEAACASARTLAATVPGVAIARSTGNFSDEALAAPVRGCGLVVTGSFARAPQNGDAASRLHEGFTARGWLEMPAYAADGKDGTAFALRKGPVACLFRGSWNGGADGEPPVAAEDPYRVSVICTSPVIPEERAP